MFCRESLIYEQEVDKVSRVSIQAQEAIFSKDLHNALFLKNKTRISSKYTNERGILFFLSEMNFQAYRFLEHVVYEIFISSRPLPRLIFFDLALTLLRL